MKHTVQQQGGFALIAALFVLVVLAAIGAFAVRANVTQQNATDLDLATAHADSALHTGVEYAAARLAPPTIARRFHPVSTCPPGSRLRSISASRRRTRSIRRP